MGGTDFGGWDFIPSVGGSFRDVDRAAVVVVADVIVVVVERLGGIDGR